MFFLVLPAEAHHPGGGGNTGSGGPINTISADTLSEGLIAASVPLRIHPPGASSATPICSPQRGKGTHAHSIRSIDAVSLSVGLRHHQ